MFDKKWFQQHQRKLLWFANRWFGRRIFCINGNKSSVGKREIVKIEPHAITWLEGVKVYQTKDYKVKVQPVYSTEFGTHNKFAKRLYCAFYPIWWMIHKWDILIANNFQPAWNLGFDTFTSSTFLGGAGRFKHSNATSWATSRNATDATEMFATYEIQSTYTAPTWINQRVFLPIDTSTIPVTATITAVTLNFNGNYEGGHTGTVAHLIQTTQSNTGTRTAADYNNVAFTTGGNVAVSDAGATAKSITGNATALTWIVKAGTTKLGLITTADLSNIDPNGGTKHWATIGAPQLVVTYIPLAAGGNPMFFSGGGLAVG